MRRRLISVFATVLVLVLTVGCKTDQEKIQETLETYAEAVILHRAPYQAYVHIDPDDKKHISVEKYASTFDEREKAFPAGTLLTVGDVSIKGDRAESLVTVTPPDEEAVSRRYVLRRNGTKWRVWLGLKLREVKRAKLDEARRLAEDGALQEAREKLEEVASTNFEASQPELIETEAASLKKWLDDRERNAELDAQLAEAMKADLAGMQTAEGALSKRIEPSDEDFFARLQKLRDEIALRERQKAMEEFTFEDVKARSFRDAWGIFREVRFNATNNTGRALKKLGVRIELLNEDDEPPVGSTVWQLVEDGTTFAPKALLEVKREVEKAPEDWKGRNVRLYVDELEFADEADDAG